MCTYQINENGHNPKNDFMLLLKLTNSRSLYTDTVLSTYSFGHVKIINAPVTGQSKPLEM